MAKHAANPDHIMTLTPYQIDALKRLSPTPSGRVEYIGKHGVRYARGN